MNDGIGSFLGSMAPVLVLVMTGYAFRRMGVAGPKSTSILGKIVLLVFFPVLVFHRLSTAGTPESILVEWPVLVWAVVVLAGSALVGWGWHALFRPPVERRLFAYLTGMPNWIYLPLAFAGPVWGDEAVRLIILFNIPTQFLLWTGGIWLLKGEWREFHPWRSALSSPGLWATVAGLLVVFGVLPFTFEEGAPGISLVALAPAMHMIGGLTIPLSLLALGLYLGQKASADAPVLAGALQVTLVRLVIAPLILGALVFGSAFIGDGGNPMIRRVVYMILVMPIAVSTPIFAALCGHDTSVASRSVAFSTVAAAITAPLLLMLVLGMEP